MGSNYSYYERIHTMETPQGPFNMINILFSESTGRQQRFPIGIKRKKM